MSTAQELRNGLQRAWNQLGEGWRELRQRAGHALTRFRPRGGGQELETAADQFVARAARWGLLAAEVHEDGDQVVVRLEAPGMEAEDFDVSVDDDLLVVRGEKRAGHQRREGNYTLLECAYGWFERAIPLPAPVDQSRARARYRRGVLEIELPKAELARRRLIEVQEA